MLRPVRSEVTTVTLLLVFLYTVLVQMQSLLGTDGARLSGVLRIFNKYI